MNIAVERKPLRMRKLSACILAAALVVAVGFTAAPAKADRDHGHDDRGRDRGYYDHRGPRHWYHGHWVYGPVYQPGYVAAPPPVVYAPPPPESPGINLIVPLHIR